MTIIIPQLPVRQLNILQTVVLTDHFTQRFCVHYALLFADLFCTADENEVMVKPHG